MRPSRLAGNIVFAAVVLLLVGSISSFLVIPRGPFWGIDFQNLYAFHSCAARNNPYLATGAACHDMGARDMNYPPLMYWLFLWVRGLKFETANAIWATSIGIGVTGSLLVWAYAQRRERWASARVGLFIGLLIAQFPVTFAMERGNNDVVVLVTWTMALYLFQAGRPGAAGFLSGLSATLKVYPVFACLVVGAALAFSAVRERRGSTRRAFAAFALGGVAAVACSVAVLPKQTMTYVSSTLPRITGFLPPLHVFGHALYRLHPAWGGWALSLPMLAAWCIGGALAFRRDALLVFAGAFAISTYFATTSWDYNLISTYPLLLVLFVKSLQERNRGLATGLLLLGLLAIVGHRGLFDGGRLAMQLHIVLQWLWLVATGASASRLAASSEAHPVTDREDGSAEALRRPPAAT